MAIPGTAGYMPCPIDVEPMLDGLLTIEGLKIHDLKTDPHPFRSVWDGSKTAELRIDDRDFKPGHVLRLLEFDRNGSIQPGVYTGRRILAVITHITDADSGYGMPRPYVMLSIKRVRRWDGKGAVEDLEWSDRFAKVNPVQVRSAFEAMWADARAAIDAVSREWAQFQRKHWEEVGALQAEIEQFKSVPKTFKVGDPVWFKAIGERPNTEERLAGLVASIIWVNHEESYLVAPIDPKSFTTCYPRRRDQLEHRNPAEK